MRNSALKNISNIIVFGAGLSGFNALKKAGLRPLMVNREFIKSLNTDEQVLEVNIEEEFSKAELIILSPGIPREHSLLKGHLGKVISEIELGFQLIDSKAPIVAITGSNGKTTVTTMVSEFLKSKGKSVFCGGNIGRPFCDLFLEGQNPDVIVLELSSFQLESINEFKPDVAAILNIVPTHMERYQSFDDYKKAKHELVKNLKDPSKVYLGEGTLKEFKSGISLDEIDFDFSKGKVRGEHNQLNFKVAYALCEKVLSDLSINEFQRFVESFSGVKHRLEYLGEKEGVKVYNDSKSTNITATITAIKSFNEPVSLVLGGKVRNENDRFLKDLLPFKDQVKEIFLIGEAQDKLLKELSPDFAVIRIELKNIFKQNFQTNTLVFSPAHPSFDQFKNFEQRGEFLRNIFDS